MNLSSAYLFISLWRAMLCR